MLKYFQTIFYKFEIDSSFFKIDFSRFLTFKYYWKISYEAKLNM